MDKPELNETFTAQSFACLKCWPEPAPDKVNVPGGEIARPRGASEARIDGHLAPALGRRLGVAATCIGAGQGLEVVLRR